ncbi:uncharacterized protein LOC132805080 [Ziziphus jujuba]|uniref:Uncharacterized protein LOC132805080 n=1 Tax=Ziziphus jujuba TaxID=326968 RepID=A0ABM4AGG8_ZIZJJ|nr:uncharacterized protein LOC132805080 [Ziziphus jujuba]
MSLVLWNCRGLGKASAVRDLKCLIRKSSSLGLFLMETKSDKMKMTKVARGSSFDNLEVVEATRRAGGLALFWSSVLNWKVVHKSRWIIGILYVTPTRVVCNCWFCHCPAERALRKLFWTKLSVAIRSESETWCCVGDFNDVVSQDEKMGARWVTSKANFFLRAFITDVGALDLGYSGPTFTWCNGREGIDNFSERLNRVLASPE